MAQELMGRLGNGTMARVDARRARRVVGHLAQAFREVEEFDRFAKGLEAALGQLEFFDRAALKLADPTLNKGANEAAHFAPGTLCVPVAQEGRTYGTAEFSNGQHKFGPNDLHLMAGLADLISVLAGHALQFGEQRRNLALLNFLLNQMPVGVACFDRERRLLVSNSLGRRWLGLGSGQKEAQRLPENWMKSAGGVEEFHRWEDGQLLHVQVKTTSAGAGEEVTAWVLADLTAEREVFHEALARETYRCGWLARPVSLAVIGAEAPGELMALLRPVRERLGAEMIVGPCDSDAIGIVFPEAGFTEAMEHLRAIRSLLSDDWELGVAASSDLHESPEALFADAAAARQKVGHFLRRRLLLHDDYASVNNMLEMVLRDEFSVVKSGDFNVALRHLRAGYFDGFFSEIDLSHGNSPLELARVARQVNPRVQSFFTSCAAAARREDPLFRHEIVLQKPFDVREVVETVKGAFASVV